MEKVCSAWRAGLPRVCGLPATVHNILMPSISFRPLLLGEIAKRFISYIQRCQASYSELVKFVTIYVIGVGRMTSPVESSTQFAARNLVLFCMMSMLCRRRFVCKTFFVY